MMKKILVCSEDSLSIIRIERLLFSKNLPFDIQKSPIKKDELFQYEIIIVHSSWRLSNVFSFIENNVLAKTIPIIYISSVINIAAFVKIMNSSYFSVIEENKLDNELLLTITMMIKFKTELELIKQEYKKSINKEELKQMMVTCKKILMSQGFSEDEAHHFILKKAMNNQISKFDVCMQIIKENNRNDIE